jgi:cell division protein FtsL
MIRYPSFLIFFIILFLGVSLYQVKHLITKKEIKLAQIQNNIKNAQSNIKILKAELSYLKRPDRIEKIALNKLGLREVSPTEIWNLKDLVDATDILSNGKNK